MVVISALLSSCMMEGIICFLRLLMPLIPACLLALDQSGSHGALFQSHGGEVQKYRRRAEDKTRREEQAAEGTGFTSCHCILLQHSSRSATSPSLSSAVKWGQWYQPLLREAVLVGSSPSPFHPELSHSPWVCVNSTSIKASKMQELQR